ncbi:hypothetical protein [Aurantiacibacter arachoides]|nr:hypothetical protein [Aurantiacibacter arachoides]
MAKAVALTRELSANPLEALRVTVVAGCALALIAAGQILPL